MKDSTYILFLLDRSGSMAAIRTEVISGFNEFVKEQQQVGGVCLFKFVQFDSIDPQWEVFKGPIEKVKRLDGDSYVPRSCTPLLDATGMAIDNLGKELAKLDEADRPSRVIFVTFTDGEENASRYYTTEKVKQMVEEQQGKYNWKFLFMGIGIDAWQVGQTMGYQRVDTQSFDHTGAGMKRAYVYTSAIATSCRTNKGGNSGV